MSERWKILDDVADQRNLGSEYRKGYSSTEVVLAAEEAFPELKLGVLFPWQLCSGFAHGRPWAFQGGTPREEMDDEDPDMVILKLTPSLSTTLYPTMAAVELAQAFLRLYESRAEAV